MFLEECLNKMNSLLIHFKVLGFQIHFHLVQPWSHSLHLHFLPYEKVRQPCLYGTLGRTPTWSSTYNIQTICSLAHDFCNLIVLCHGFTMLHHEDSEGVKDSQKFFGRLCLSLCGLFPFLVPWKLCGHFGPICPILPLWVHPMEPTKNYPHHELLKGMQGHMHGGSSLGSKIYSFLLLFLGAMGGFFTSETMFASVFPLFWAVGEGVFSWTRTLFNLAPYFPFFFLLLWGGAILASSSNNSLKL